MAKNFLACRIATTNGEDLSLEGGVVLYVQVLEYELQWVPLPRHSVSGWGLQRQWRCGFRPSPPPGYLSPVAMRARVGTGYPSMPLHGAACCLGAFFMSLVNFTGDIPACKEKATNNMKKRTSVHMHIFMREYLF